MSPTATAVMPATQVIKGSRTPRLSTEPLRPLTRETSRGYSLIDFAELIGLPLLPWQQEAAIRALELNPDGSYRFRTVLILVSRQSGKTSLLKVWALWRMYVDGAKLVVGAAQSLDISREAWQGAVELAKDCPALAAELGVIRYANGEQCINLLSGARYRITATTRGAGRGLSVDFLILDEVREQRDWLAWASLSKCTVARAKGQTVCISNMGDDQSVVLNSLRDSALAGRDPSLGLFEWSAPEGCELDDVSAWAQACPGLGYTISEQAIRSALATDPPNVFRTEMLTQRVDSMDSAVDISAWKRSADATGSLAPHRDRLAACFDVALDNNHATLAIAAELPDGRVRVEIAGSWRSTEDARRELPALLDKLQPQIVTWFPNGPANAFRPMLTARADSLELSGNHATASCMGLADLVVAGRVLHPGDALLDAQMSGASRWIQGDSYRFVRKGVGHVDAVYACAGAVYAALTLPASVPAWFGSHVV